MQIRPKALFPMRDTRVMGKMHRIPQHYIGTIDVFAIAQAVDLSFCDRASERRNVIVNFSRVIAECPGISLSIRIGVRCTIALFLDYSIAATAALLYHSVRILQDVPIAFLLERERRIRL